MLDSAPHFRKPNIRALFTPDSGYLLVDADLSGADAQVVFAEAEEWSTVERLATGVKLHVETARAFYGERFARATGDIKNKLSEAGRFYASMKQAAHASAYGASGRTIALTQGWPLSEGERFKRLYLRELHPGIGAWQNRVELELRTSRSTANAFGYRIHWFDRIDALLPEALAWGPQSTVAITTFIAAERVRQRFPFVEFLVQVHDSLVFQLPLSERGALPLIALALEVEVPYKERPLVIPWKLAVSETSWGEAKAWSPNGAA